MKRLSEVLDRKLRLSVAISAVAVSGLALYLSFCANAGDRAPAAILRVSSLEYIVEADGLIESALLTEVHAPSGLKVRALYVNEGDAVEEGATLARLDTEALELEIQRAELNIRSAEANMSNEQTALANSVTGARNALASADVSLQAARREYESLRDRRGDEPAVEVAAINLDAAQRAYEYSVSLFGIGEISREALIQSENALEKARTAHDDALKGAGDALDRAREAYEAAGIKRKTANDTLQDAIAKNTDPAAVALELQRVALREKEIRLRDASILAPSGGIVTLVNAKLGAPASGLMFIIEDTRDIRARARVSETDIASVKAGDRCLITPAGQARGFGGRVTSLPFAAEREPSGAFSAVVGDDAYFVVEVIPDEAPEGIYIGMNVKVSIVTDSREACFAVPNGLIQREGARRWIIAGGAGEKPGEIPVETGLETRRLTEITGEGLYEGLRVYAPTR